MSEGWGNNMRPCNSCGTAIANDAQFCHSCSLSKTLPTTLRQESDDTDRASDRGAFPWGLLFDFAFRTILCGIPVVAVVFFLLWWIFPLSWAIVGGCVIGLLTSMVYSGIAMYFQGQAVRGPLG